MGSRERILQSILNAKKGETSLPQIENRPLAFGDNAENFKATVAAVGGKVIEVGSLNNVSDHVKMLFPSGKIISTIEQLAWYSPYVASDPHTYEDVELAILNGHFGVAENGAVWVTDSNMLDRAIPFIAQHLALVVERINIVPTLNEAYGRINSLAYDFGVFIAGPSKTADIEQSLVFGAHGPKSLTLFLIG
jgi:L-lactate dehydrogenase complex protein LldG